MSGKIMRRSMLAAAVLALLVGGTGRAAADLVVGDNLTVQFEADPFAFNPYAGPVNVVFALPSVSINDIPNLNPPDAFVITFFPTLIEIDVVSDINFTPGFTFNGMVISDDNPNLTGAAIFSNSLAGFSAARFAATDTSISLNFDGLTFSEGQSLVITLGVSAVPEPSTLAGCGLIAVALAGYRLRGRAKVA